MSYHFVSDMMTVSLILYTRLANLELLKLNAILLTFKEISQPSLNIQQQLVSDTHLLKVSLAHSLPG